MDKELEKKLAVWFLTHDLAETIQQALDFVRLVEKGETSDEMVGVIERNINLKVKMDGEVTPAKALAFMREKREGAEKLIKLWEGNPKDTNAIFFSRAYKGQDWTGVE